MYTKIGTYDAMNESIEMLGQGGLLLMTGTKGNPMTIGWGTIGQIWGRPIFIVLVRPSRYSFGLLEDLPEFAVNVPTPDIKKWVALCGSKSGRDMDKISECGFTLVDGRDIKIPSISECTVHYECRVIHKSNVINADLDPEIVSGSYPAGDLHRVYYGEILGVYRKN